MNLGRNIEQKYTEFESNFPLFFLCSHFWKTNMVDLYSLWNIENTNIAVHCLQSRVKVMGNKGEDTGKIDVTSKEKNIFSQKT